MEFEVRHECALESALDCGFEFELEYKFEFELGLERVGRWRWRELPQFVQRG